MVQKLIVRPGQVAFSSGWESRSGKAAQRIAPVPSTRPPWPRLEARLKHLALSGQKVATRSIWDRPGIVILV